MARQGISYEQVAARAAEAETALAQALGELAVMATNGEALEAERDDLAQQPAKSTNGGGSCSCCLCRLGARARHSGGKADEQATEIERLTQEAARQQEELAGVRRALAQAELRLEAVPRLEDELASLRGQLASELSMRAVADKSAAVAEAQRAAEEVARQRAETRLGSAEAREAEARKELAEAHAAHQTTREKLTEAVGLAAGAQAELKELRARMEVKVSDHPQDASAATTDTEDRNPPPAGRKPGRR